MNEPTITTTNGKRYTCGECSNWRRLHGGSTGFCDYYPAAVVSSGLYERPIVSQNERQCRVGFELVMAEPKPQNRAEEIAGMAVAARALVASGAAKTTGTSVGAGSFSGVPKGKRRL